MSDLFQTLLTPFELLVAWIMYGFHQAFTAIGLPPGSGWTWTLSIVGLVLVMRAAMIPLFVRQIHASRKMQLIQPEMQKIQKKYKGKSDPESRQAMTEETMELYRREGTNPFSSCLPILVQSPFFFGLFRVLNYLDDIARGPSAPNGHSAIGPITQAVAKQAESASIFGAQLSDTFKDATTTAPRVLTITLVVLMSATTFLTQRQLTMKNMPASALDNPFARQQKALLYILPIVFAISGIGFPIGVLIYWFTTNVWSMGQQFYVIRRMPTPGSAAEKAMHERRSRRGLPVITSADVAESTEDPEAEEPKASGQRTQPKGKKRAKKDRPKTPPTSAETDDPPTSS